MVFWQRLTVYHNHVNASGGLLFYRYAIICGMGGGGLDTQTTQIDSRFDGRI